MKAKIILAILLLIFLTPIGIIYIVYLLLTKIFKEEIQEEAKTKNYQNYSQTYNFNSTNINSGDDTQC